jgi:spore coat protein A
MKYLIKIKTIFSCTLLLLVLLAFISLSPNVYGQYLDPDIHPKFVNDLPNPAKLDFTKGKGKVTLGMYQTTQWLGLVDDSGDPLMTTVWGYGKNSRSVTYPGPTIIAKEDVPLDIRWNNNLPSSGHILPVDLTMHMAHPSGVSTADFYAAGNIPTVVHLHGGHTESASDGLPEAWFTQNFETKGPFFVKRTSHYDNDQEGATLWYHDHALGITRLNVYAGLAGFYILRDNNELNMIKNDVLPSGNYEREIVIQDRMFYNNGELFLPSKDGDPFFDGILDGVADLGGVEPSIVAEFFGDFIIVNSIAWPKLNVKKNKYRFRMLNGSDSRVYKLEILDTGSPITFYQIGTDNGFLEYPVPLTELILAPGERADLIVDFTNLSGSLTMVNTGPDEPFKGANFNTDITRPTGQIMQFNVKNGGNPPTFSIGSGTNLNTIAPLTQTGPTRKLALFEGSDDKGRLQPLLGVINGDNAKDPTDVVNGSLAWFEDITENPDLNDVEVWEVYNATEDAHPIHLHLVTFQILERRPYDALVNTQSQAQHDGTTGIGGYVVESSINFTGPAEAPAPNEMGWKDTFVVPPGYMGKVIAKFDRPGRYVWHCHILSHEDHEMMRPYYVGPVASNARMADSGSDVQQNSPNPFASGTEIRFELKQAENVQLTIYDMAGRDIIYQHMDFYQEGKHALFWDGVDKDGRYLPDGIYIYRVKGESFEDTKKLIIDR